METLYLFCAIFGGTVLVAQFLLGFGGHEHGGADDADGVDAMHGDGAGGHDADGHDADGHDADAHATDGHDTGHHGTQTHHGSTWVFGVLTFRTVLIGITFFGLTGKAASASGFAQPRPLAIAVVCGLAAMYGVYFLMRGLYKLTADGTERIGRAVGEEGVVYLTIPGHNAGAGKVQVPVQNRTVEYEAMTAGEKLPTGMRVVVVGVLGSDRVEVEPVTEPARNTNV
jgi:hypothetical protein